MSDKYTQRQAPLQIITVVDIVEISIHAFILLLAEDIEFSSYPNYAQANKYLIYYTVRNTLIKHLTIYCNSSYGLWRWTGLAKTESAM